MAQKAIILHTLGVQVVYTLLYWGLFSIPHLPSSHFLSPISTSECLAGRSTLACFWLTRSGSEADETFECKSEAPRAMAFVKDLADAVSGHSKTVLSQSGVLVWANHSVASHVFPGVLPGRWADGQTKACPKGPRTPITGF